MKVLSFYRYPHPNNVGDTLTPEILRHFIPDDVIIQQVRENRKGKLLGVGSIMRAMQAGDTVWGSGVMHKTDQFPHAPGSKFLAVRGKLSREILLRNGGDVPEVYGDPAVLLPLIYRPEVEVTHEVGIIPHFVDRQRVRTRRQRKHIGGSASFKMIDVFLPWRDFVDEVLSCKRIVSSSLHGIIIAEAYGVQAEWRILSHRVLGKGFKFLDYLTGTEREQQMEGYFPPIDPEVLASQQQGLLDVLLSDESIYEHIEKKPTVRQT